MLDNILGFYSKIRDYLTGGLAIALVLAGLGWHIETLKYKAADAHYAAEVNGRAADRANYEKALADFKSQAIKNKMETETNDNVKATNADANFATLYGKYTTLLMRYNAATKSGSGELRDLPGTPEASQGSDGPGTDSFVLTGETVTIPYDDAKVCAVNTARLMAIQPWALDLLKENEEQAGKLPDDSSKK